LLKQLTLIGQGRKLQQKGDVAQKKTKSRGSNSLCVDLIVRGGDWVKALQQQGRQLDNRFKASLPARRHSPLLTSGFKVRLKQQIQLKNQI
jgi:hypothetical protein